MSNLISFNYNGIRGVRVIQKDGEPWFVLRDVCDVLELSTPGKVAERLEEDEVTLTHITDSIGRSQETTVVNESGLYNVILRSDKPEAKQFKRWITHEVIPSIRKHGAYMTPETIEKALLDPDTIINLATRLKEEHQKRIAAESKINEDKPKVLFAEAVTTSKSSVLIGELAKILKQNGINIGQNRLFQWLRENGYLCERGENYNLPTQYAMERGLFEIKKSTVNNPDGSSRVNRTPKVTGKGQVYFVNKFIDKSA